MPLSRLNLLVTQLRERRRLALPLALVAMCSFVPAANAQDVAPADDHDPIAHLGEYAHEHMCKRADHPNARFLCKGLRLINSDGTHEIARATPRATPMGYGPSDLQSAYALDPSLGEGMTVGIVDAFGYSKAEADLAMYRSTFGLPACTSASGCLKIVGQDGGAPPPDPTNSKNAQWNGEAALDIDMVSAACPKCKIILVLVNSDQDDGLELGQQTAATLGANVISNSWGGPDNDPSSEEHYFMTTPAVGIFVASGDLGYDNQDSSPSGPDYPSTSSYAIGVGGTALTRTTSNARGWSELPWGEDSGQGAAGSSCSAMIPKPTYQAAVIPDSVCKFRAAADTSAVASLKTGVAVYQGGWGVAGGTSVASPLVATIFAMNGEALAGPSLPYLHPDAFTDVTGGTTANSNDSTGQCGAPLCIAGTGWDGQTGMGTPIGSALHMLADPPDMAVPPDFSVVTSTHGGGNGNGNSDGGVASSHDNGCGCSLGGASASPAASGFSALALALVGLTIYRRRRRA